MRPRYLMALLLLPFALATAGGAQEEQGGARLQTHVFERQELSPVEEQEARELALLFMRRLRDTDDFGPLVEELFAGDLFERFQQAVRDRSFDDWGEGDIFDAFQRDAILQATPEDLRRAYVALMNLCDQGGRVRQAGSDTVFALERAGQIPVQRGGRYAETQERIVRGALAPDFFAAAEDDPLLALIVAWLMGTLDDDTGAAQRVEAAAVRSVGRLRSFTEKAERLAPMLREAAKTLRSAPVLHPRGAEENYQVYRIEARTLPEAFFGFPAGTKFIRARISAHEVFIVGDGGALRIVAARPGG